MFSAELQEKEAITFALPYSISSNDPLPDCIVHVHPGIKIA